MSRLRATLGISAALIVLAPTIVTADPAVDKDTKCQVIVDYLDRKDSPHAQEAFRAAKQMMTDFDTAATAKGLPSLLTPLSGDKLENVFILVLESCRDYPRQTLGQTAADTYDGSRDIRGLAPSH